MCIILWFFIHVSHRSKKCVAVVIAAALYDPLPSIFPSDLLFVCWSVGRLLAYRGSPVVVVLYYARASFSLGDLLLLVCLLAEVLLLLLFCMMFAYMYHPKL